MGLLVKICGIRNPGDAEFAAEAGANAVGVVLAAGSPRTVPLEIARDIVHSVRGWALTVAVVVDASVEQARRLVDDIGFDIVQFHGDESPAVLARFAAEQAWKAVHLRTPQDLRTALDHPCSILVADAASGARRGGTGRTCDWTLAAELARLRRMILAGGLTPDNVVEAVVSVRPAGVDVSSGVESAPGRKDRSKLRDFITAAREAETRLARRSGPLDACTGKTPETS